MVRGKGEGSIYRRGDGRWVAQIEAPRSPTGRRRYARAVRRTRTQAQDALRDLHRSAEAGVTPDHTTTLNTYLHWWLDNVVPGTVEPGTVTKYRWVADHWIIPHVGTVRLAKLTPAHVQRMLSRLSEAGLSPRSAAQARAVLVRALRWAEQTDMVGRNVARIVDGPRLRRHPSDALDATEAEAVITQARGDRLEALAILALRLGLRRGELLALRWDDVNLEVGELTVTDSKTEAGRRTLPLVAGTLDALKTHRRRQAAERLEAGPLWADTGYVFCNETGKPVAGRQALAWWHSLTTSALGQRRRFHASRHSCATLLLAQGVPLETVSAVMGHAALSITSDTYARVTNDAKRRALSKLGQGLE